MFTETAGGIGNTLMASHGDGDSLAGFFLVDALDLNAAIKVTEGMPQAKIGSIEVRPIKDLAKH